MSLHETLQRVEEDIAAGNLGRARDRLHGLVWQYPDELSLRSKLAEVYWQLRFPTMAGCYWYLEEPTTEAMQQAHAEFERACGNDPFRILTHLKFRGNVKDLPPYARYRLERLQQECQCKYGRYPVFNAQGASWRLTPPTWRHHLATWGCVLALLAILGLTLLGAGVALHHLLRILQHVFGSIIKS